MRNDDRLPSPSGGFVKGSCTERKEKELHLHIKAKTSLMYKFQKKRKNAIPEFLTEETKTNQY